MEANGSPQNEAKDLTLEASGTPKLSPSISFPDRSARERLFGSLGAQSTVVSTAAITRAKNRLRSSDSYYEVYSVIKSFVNRCTARGKHLEAICLCHEFGLEFLRHGRFDCVSGLGMHMIQIFTEFELAPTADLVDLVLELFEPVPPTPDKERHRFIEQAIKWATTEGGAQSDAATRLRKAAGKSYFYEKLFGDAQRHMLSTASGEELAKLVSEWQTVGYASEKDLFTLRLILLLLARGDVKRASDLISSKKLNLDFDDPELSPPLQLAYLLTEACQAQDAQFFDALQSKYSLVIRRDPVFFDCLSYVDKRVFNRRPADDDFSIVNLLSGFFGPGSENAQQTTLIAS